MTCPRCNGPVHWYVRPYRNNEPIIIGGKQYGHCECSAVTWVNEAGHVRSVVHALEIECECGDVFPSVDRYEAHRDLSHPPQARPRRRTCRCCLSTQGAEQDPDCPIHGVHS